MGFGGAQLGKAVKGRSKDRRRLAGDKSRSGGSGLAADVAALEEYEKLNEQAEKQRSRLKSLASQELSASRVNHLIITQSNRQEARQEKVQELRVELEAIAQQQSRDAARRDELIAVLLRDLSSAEQQSRQAQRDHSIRLRQLAELQSRKLSALEAEFQRDLKQLKKEFLDERDELSESHAREVKEFQLLIERLENEESERMNEARQQHETEREEIRNKNLEGINELRINLENRIEELERQFDESHRQYIESTDQANEHFKKLKAEDAALSLLIFEKKKKIVRLQQLLASWRKKLQFNHAEGTQRNENIKQQKEAINKYCEQLKEKMKKFRANENGRLTQLANQSRAALKYNQQHLTAAEKILALAEMARKFETEREKVQPFDINKKIQTLVQTEQKQQQINGAEEDQSAWLAQFYSRYNKVLLDQLAIEEERTRLRQENQELKQLLKQYLDGVTVSEEVMAKENPLLIVNGRLQLANTQLVKTMPRVTQEAAAIHSNYQRQTHPAQMQMAVTGVGRRQ